MSNAISEYLEELVSQKSALAANLTTMGVSASSSEKLNTLVPKVLEIGGSDNAHRCPRGEPVSVFRYDSLITTTMSWTATAVEAEG